MRKILDLAERALSVAAMSGFIVMLVITGAQVLFRYVLKIPVPWTEELARILFVLSVFLGIAIATRRSEHIVVDFLLKKLPPRVLVPVVVLFGIAILAFLALWARGSATMIDVTWETRFISVEWFRLGYIYLAELVGVGLTAVFLVAQVFDTVATLLKPNAKAAETGQ